VTSTPAAVTQAAARGAEAAISTIPWTQVGPGWLLATWSQVPGRSAGGELSPGEPTPATATTTLYLVDPAGGRYPITTFPPPGAGPSPTLADWSGDGTHALFYAYAPAPSGTYTVTTVDLRSGAPASFTIDNGTNSFDVAARYSRPQGKAVLLAKSNGAKAGWLKRVDLAGRPELTYPVGRDFQGSYLSTPDGTQLVLGTAVGLALMGNDGTAGKTLPVTGEQDHGPARLWLVPTSGEPPTALTAPLNGQGPDYGDIDAWQLPSDTFVQVAGACGSEYLGELSAVGGTTTRVDVPDVDPRSSIRVIGPNTGHLVVQGRASCGDGQALFDYDPAANTSTVLLGPPLNGGGVIAALPYPGRG
jgi:TolB protein